MAEAREAQYLHELVRQLEAANVTGNVANTPQEVPGFRWFPGYSQPRGGPKRETGWRRASGTSSGGARAITPAIAVQLTGTRTME